MTQECIFIKKISNFSKNKNKTKFFLHFDRKIMFRGWLVSEKENKNDIYSTCLSKVAFFYCAGFFYCVYCKSSIAVPVPGIEGGLVPICGDMTFCFKYARRAVPKQYHLKQYCIVQKMH
jgi:hypothetical protein